jgi:hypothetical protein
VTNAVIRDTVNGTSDVFMSSCVEKIPVGSRSPVQRNLLCIRDRSCVRIMNLHMSTDVIGDICMRLAERVARGGEISWKNENGKDHLRDLGVHIRVILK